MTIFTSLYSIPNHDHIESWRGAFRYLKQAEPLFQVRPKTRINLATARPGRARIALKVAGEVLGGAALFLLAFGLLVVAGVVMGVV